MFRFIRQAPDRPLNVARGEIAEFSAVTPGNQQGKRGASPDGGCAAPYLEPGIPDSSLFNNRAEPQDVAAYWVGNLDAKRRRRQFTDISGVLEMVDQLRAHTEMMTQVVAGILEKDGRVLICRRRSDQAHPLKWEFPGGKIEPGETPAEALTRELREELGIEAAPPVEIQRYEFAYPDKRPILLIFMRVPSWTGEIEDRIFDTILWEAGENLRDYDFLEGDGPFIDREWRTERSGLH